MLAKLICHAPTRDMCIDRLERALRDYIILGTKTNLSWLRRVIAHPAFLDGRVSTRFLQDHESDLQQLMPEEVQAIAAALCSRGFSPSARVDGLKPVLRDIWHTLGAWGR